MGIYDREYYRDKTRASAWFSGTAPACKAIILINVAVFLLAKVLYLEDGIINWFANSSSAVFEHGQVWRLLTCAFLHDPQNIWHILINMLILWWIGRDMEAFYGTKEFWWFYLSAAVVSSLCWGVIDLSRGTGGHELGASGAVMAVLAVYTFYNPRREVILYFIPVEMWLLLTIYVVSDGWSLLGRSGQPIAFAAHLGGVAYAFAFKTFDLRLKHLGNFNFRALKRLIPGSRPKLRLVMPPDPPKRKSPIVRPSPSTPPPSTTGSSSGSGPAPSPGPSSWTSKPAATARPSSTAVVSEESLEAKLDEILIKIASQGRESLTDEEKRILEEASRRARSRRGERIQ